LLAARAAEEYAYVVRDVRRILVVGGTVAAVLAAPPPTAKETSTVSIWSVQNPSHGVAQFLWRERLGRDRTFGGRTRQLVFAIPRIAGHEERPRRATPFPPGV
jgi:hypothetical protein